eukprot:768694-Hanusia_phi.AAC.11
MQGSNAIHVHGILPLPLKGNIRPMRNERAGLLSVHDSVEEPTSNGFEVLKKLYHGQKAGGQPSPRFPSAILIAVALVGVVLDSLLHPAAQPSFMVLPALPRKKPFFDGWFVRITDLAMQTSCSLIVGSMRRSGDHRPSWPDVCMTR